MLLGEDLSVDGIPRISREECTSHPLTEGLSSEESSVDIHSEHWGGTEVC